MAQQPEASFPKERSLLFSVVVATRNRAALLTSLLGHLCEQVRDTADTEIVIVDNQSEDETKRTVERFIQSCSGQPQIRYFYEGRLGLSAARNAGATVARGQYVVFLDDDVEPEPCWLSAYRRLVERGPNVRVAGGPIEPRPEPNVDLPSIGRRYLWVYGHLDYGPSTGPLKSGQKLNGGNVLFDRSTLLKLGGFREIYGHRGDTLGGGEEQELLAQIRRHSPTSCYYVGKAKVHHRIPASRATMEWARARLRAASEAIARLEAVHRSHTVVALKSVYYLLILAASRVLPINEWRRTECSAYRDGLRSL